MRDCIHALITHLSEHNYDHPISEKLLTRPTAKDFNSIIRFLFAQIDPGCNLPHPSKIKHVGRDSSDRGSGGCCVALCLSITALVLSLLEQHLTKPLLLGHL